MTRITFDPKVLNIVDMAQEKGSNRPNLETVLIEFVKDKQALCLVATDGHRLAYLECVYKSETGPIEHAPLLISRCDIEAFQTFLLKKTKEVSLEINKTDKKEEIFLRSDMVSTQCKEVDGQFPDWHQVVPRTEAPLTKIAFDVSYLVDYFQFLKKLGRKEKNLKLTFAGDDLSPIKVTANFVSESVIETYYILMPVRI